jgi:hypothetical protein
MACACGKTSTGAKITYIVTAPNGAKTSYSTELEAKAAAMRLGGTWRATS